MAQEAAGTEIQVWKNLSERSEDPVVCTGGQDGRASETGIWQSRNRCVDAKGVCPWPSGPGLRPTPGPRVRGPCPAEVGEPHWPLPPSALLQLFPSTHVSVIVHPSPCVSPT